ncbi:hypothetical protein Ahy_A02g009144 isoform C [Arachis hypogaea]|uniref:Coiled-coil SMC6 And NSE5 INteracting (CANIN) domain-containing protein n=1 Tax=Arachis hypogaea TaxID=3818 RepID=A0A445EG48_ARAHY|nr:hypothetical protein Ahy_A02g009144 isoform C [Arachis hypogaea]
MHEVHTPPLPSTPPPSCVCHSHSALAKNPPSSKFKKTKTQNQNPSFFNDSIAAIRGCRRLRGFPLHQGYETKPSILALLGIHPPAAFLQSSKRQKPKTKTLASSMVPPIRGCRRLCDFPFRQGSETKSSVLALLDVHPSVGFLFELLAIVSSFDVSSSSCSPSRSTVVEEDEFLKPPPNVSNKRRKKVIGLDDLLTDHLRELEKLKEEQNEQEKPKTKKAKKDASSYDDDEDPREAYLTKLLKDFGEEEDIPLWGVKVFGDKKAFPPLEFPELGSCNLLQSFLNSELNSVVELAAEKGDNFLEGLLINGWLPKLAFLCGHIEKPVAIWSFNTMLYSSNEELRNSSSDFWCAVLSSRKEVDQLPVEIAWFPEYSDLRTALDTHGFLFEFSSSGEPKNLDSDTGEPPQNIRAWLKFVTACCLIRSKRPVFSVVESEELIEIIICLFLDHQFLGLLVLLNDCVEAIVNYFTVQGWHSSCENIAKFIASRVSKNLNCIQFVECIPVASSRCKQLKSAMVYQNLLSYFDGFLCQAHNEEDILRLLRAINFKDKSCDFFKMYIHLVLTENWVLSNSLIEDNPVIYEMFCLFLRQCSSLISASDLRSYASMVRHRAAYLMHFSIYNILFTSWINMNTIKYKQSCSC